jgi:6-phosphogluconolactonase (cycloisomerase 2 family)
MTRSTRSIGLFVLLVFFGAATQLFLSQDSRMSQRTDRQTTILGHERLVSVEPLPEMSGQMCELLPPVSGQQLMASLQNSPAARARPAPAGNVLNRNPVRTIRDPYATYSAVVVDPVRNEIVLQDENLFQILTYDRLTNTPPSATMSEPKRVIAGTLTKVEFNCGLYIDPPTGDIYSIANDTVDTMVVFSRDQKGNVPPSRELHTPHRTFGIAVNENNQELFLTVQAPSAVVVYHKMAKGNEPPIRIVEGDHTRLEDPHGIALDTKNKLMFVTNHGSVAYSKEGKNFMRYPASGGGWHIPDEGERRQNMVPGSGKFLPPSITVYPIDASGDVAPVHVIEGPATQLNWPAQIFLDEARGELYVANDVGDSILVFRATDTGNAAPIRVIKGPKSGIKNPTGVYFDAQNREIVVANMGNHSATVYPRMANGDTPPLRTIRAAPLGKVALAIGNPGAVSYDTKRDQILVPN